MTAKKKTKPIEIRFLIDPDQMLIEDLIKLEEGSVTSTRQIVELLATFVIDSTGTYIDREDATELLMKQSVVWLKGAQTEIMKQMEAINETVVPNE